MKVIITKQMTVQLYFCGVYSDESRSTCFPFYTPGLAGWWSCCWSEANPAWCWSLLVIWAWDGSLSPSSMWIRISSAGEGTPAEMKATSDWESQWDCDYVFPNSPRCSRLATGEGLRDFVRMYYGCCSPWQVPLHTSFLLKSNPDGVRWEVADQQCKRGEMELLVRVGCFEEGIMVG